MNKLLNRGTKKKKKKKGYQEKSTGCEKEEVTVNIREYRNNTGNSISRHLKVRSAETLGIEYLF